MKYNIEPSVTASFSPYRLIGDCIYPYNATQFNNIKDQINSNPHYDYLSFYMRPFHDYSPLTTYEISNLTSLLHEINPTVESINFSGGFDSHQAAQVIEPLSKLNTNMLFLRTNCLDVEGLTAFTDTLANTPVSRLSLQGEMNEAVVAQLDFSKTKIYDLDLKNTHLTGAGITGLFDKLADSSVVEFTFYNDDFSKDAIKMADFSKTHISDLMFLNSPLSDIDFNNLHLNESSIKILSIVDQDLNSNSARILSEKLMHSSVENLRLDCYFEDNALANLKLQNTPVVHLNLANSHLSAQMLSELDLKGTSVKTIDLLNTKITEDSVAMIKSMIAGTPVTEVKLGETVFENGELFDRETFIYNHSPCIKDDAFSIQPEKAMEALNIHDIISTDSKLDMPSSAPVATSEFSVMKALEGFCVSIGLCSAHSPDANTSAMIKVEPVAISPVVETLMS